MKAKQISKSFTALLAALVLAGTMGGCRKAPSKTSGASAQTVPSEAVSGVSSSKVGSAASSTSSAVSGTKSTSAASNSVGNPNPSTTGGTVKLLYPSEAKQEMTAIIAGFRKKYPKITVVPEMYSGEYGDLTTQLNVLAAAKKLPDIVEGTQDFGYLMKQGWIYPLDKLYAADPDKNDAYQPGISRYTYFGHLYALPYRLQFSTIVVNLDLLDTLNMDPPSYNWTIDQFVSMAKKATTTQYSGINVTTSSISPTHNLTTKLMTGMMAAPYQLLGYRLDTHVFNLTNGAWVNAQKTVQDLKSVPGLVSDDLKNQTLRNEGKMDDYQKKFGKDADAFVSGKVLFGDHDPWDYDWLRKLNYKWDYYPVPTQKGIPQRIETHVDFASMLTTVTEQNRTAAYQLLKFLSYDKDGCLIRMKIPLEEPNSLQKVTLMIPASRNSEVSSYFNSAKGIPNGLKYMYNTVMKDPKNSAVMDCDKLVPDFWTDVQQYSDAVDKKIQAGADPASLAVDFQNKVNSAVTDTWNSFSKKMQQNIATFYQTHPWEK